jgi:lysophospholipase L1-like esterase
LRLRWSIALGLMLVVLGPLAPAAAAFHHPYYLAVGASESLGVQPTFLHPRGLPTDRGYANDLVALERRRWPGLVLVQVACPGLTVPEALQGGGRCRFPEGTELATATHFLDGHRDSTVLVTIDLGFNDVRPCLARFRVDQSCVRRALSGIRSSLPVLLGRLVAAAGRGTHIVGLRHNDPYLADAGRRTTEQFADDAQAAFAALNTELQRIYTRSGVITADTPHEFNQQVRRVVGPGSPQAQGVCALTWMCAAAPLGPNLHPNSSGYHLIADSIASALDRALGPPR